MVQHLRKLIITFHKDHFDKPKTTLSSIDPSLPMAKPMSKHLVIKQKRGQSVKASNANKHAKKS